MSLGAQTPRLKPTPEVFLMKFDRALASFVYPDGEERIADGDCYRVDFETNADQLLVRHDAAVKCVEYSTELSPSPYPYLVS
jgi:hypothetical protein